MLTHLLTAPDLDALEAEMLARSTDSIVWLAALDLLRQHRTASFKRRCKLIRTRTLGGRRRTL